MAGRDEQHEGGAPVGEAAADAFEALLQAASHVPALGLPAPEPADFLEGRFRIERRLGEGGMGVVYEAFDRQRKQTVALKTLTQLDPAGVYRLKQEFRALSHVVHPNLVALHELFFDRDRWFFTMDRVDGVAFTRCGARVGLLCDLLYQLLSGVRAIHESGKLHRDLKPSNVLVTPRGRVVILDFGLVTDLAGESAPDGPTSEGALPGTPAYMSPEQAAGEPPTEKSDLYAVGVMLYEALTGRLPFAGPSLKVLHDKRARDPVAPEAIAEGVPPGLSRLCMQLLSRDPAARPDCERALAQLDVAPARESGAPPPPADSTLGARAGERFVGRHGQLLALARAFEASRRGPRVVFIKGSSGMGKTALVRHFLRGLLRDRTALVLRGRCYEREAVPFKAFDGIVDDLSRHLRRLERHEAAALLPRDVHSLGRIFPVLRRAEPVSRAAGRITESSDPAVLRQRAFRALKEMLQRLSDRHPLVLFIDDLQWSDLDSARLLEEVVSPPEPPPLLVIGCYRREEAESSGFLKQVLRRPPRLSTEELYRVRLSTMLRAEIRTSFGGEQRAAARDEAGDPVRGDAIVDDLALRSLTDVTELSVDRLTCGEAAALARSLLPAGEPAQQDELSAQIARESEGIPLYVRELVQHVSAEHTFDYARRAPPASLDEMLRARIAALPPDACRLIETVALSGRPIGQDLALRAAGLSTGDVRAMQLLRAQSLVRTRGSAITDPVEVYHDRVARAACASMSSDALRRCHERLATTLEAAGAASPQWLAELFEGAGLSERAARYAMRAADDARGSLAFSRAQEMSRWAQALFRSQEAHEVRQGALIGAGLGTFAGAIVAAIAVHYFKADHELGVKLGIYSMGLFGGGPLGMMLGSVASLLTASDPERLGRGGSFDEP